HSFPPVSARELLSVKNFPQNKRGEVEPAELGLIRSRIEERANRPLVRFAIALAHKISYLPPVFRVEDRNGQRSTPPGQHRHAKRGFGFRWFLPVIGEYRLVTRYEAPHQDQIAVLIHVHADDFQSFRRVQLRQFIQQGIFVAARLAPGRPEVHQQRLSAILLHQFLVSLRVNQFRVARRSRFRRLWRSQRTRPSQKAQKRQPVSQFHIRPLTFILSIALPVEKLIRPAYNEP